MNTNRTFSFDGDQFNKMFPFHLLVDKQLKIQSIGTSLLKIVPDIKIGDHLETHFKFYRPSLTNITFESLIISKAKLVVLETKTESKVLLRGQFELQAETSEFLFLGTPWFASMEEVSSFNLTLDDFAINDPMIDLLHVLKTQELNTVDIKQLMEMVTRQKKQLRTLSMIAEETVNAAILTDADGNVEWVNKAFENITGYTLKEVMGKKPGHFLQGKDTNPETIKYLRNQIRNAQKFECEILNYSKNKEPYWVKIIGEPLIDKSGKVLQFFALEENITESKLAKEKLEQTANRLSAMVTNLKTGMLLEDEHRKIVLTNKEFCSIFGINVNPELLTGADCSDSAEQSMHLFKDPQHFVKRINTLLKERKICLDEILEMADGRVLQRDYLPIFVGDKYMGHLWKYDDITVRFNTNRRIVQQEEKYRSILENMELGVIEVNNDGRIVNINKSFSEITGYTSQELIGQDPLQVLAADVEQVNRVIRNTLKRKAGKTSVYEANIRKKNGEIINLMISGGPIYDDNNELVGTIGIHLDITDRKKLEMELIQARKNAEASSAAKQLFLANMSHEIRTPLNAIIGLSSFMLMQNPPADFKENLKILNFSANNLLALITDILDFSKIEAGKIEFIATDFDIKQLIRGVYQTFLVKCQETGIDISYSITKTVPTILKGDPLRFTQVINNLVNNAVKFTPKGQVKIHVSESLKLGNKITINVRVTDTGIGIAKNRLEKIFDDFVQADNETSQKYGGTGLGLAISKQIVELQGGRIWVKSRLKKGTVFAFSLEFEIPATSKLHSKEITTIDTDQLNETLILLVEDIEINQRVAISYLNHWGAKVIVANNGEEALELFDKHNFDILLVDLYMPIMNGFETITKIREMGSGKKVPIIALTASAELSVINQALDCGANACISKPFNPAQLRAKLNELLSKSRNLKPIESKTAQKNVHHDGAASQYKNISLSRIEESSLGSKSFTFEILNLIFKEIPIMFKEAESHRVGGQFENFSKVIHKLKNNLLLLGMDHIKADLRFVEEFSRKGEKIVKVEKLFEKIKQAWQDAIPEVEEALSYYGEG